MALTWQRLLEGGSPKAWKSKSARRLHATWRVAAVFLQGAMGELLDKHQAFIYYRIVKGDFGLTIEAIEGHNYL